MGRDERAQTRESRGHLDKVVVWECAAAVHREYVQRLQRGGRGDLGYPFERLGELCAEEDAAMAHCEAPDGAQAFEREARC
ncbi:hypothetical protein FA95DRAFT_1556569 [Auriscalpium vulgare]|uniref:Uncharacterized protein n=1 Tax=Auriscalpium vulgare TaxID=40419 RepID=A0ACB8RZY5_9AGAM|nr:hypothetical protein FA95DRAFT_1556569 [Auriscalpium vulgare]